MKIRSDFVTNSSSSSMVTIQVSMKNGHKLSLFEEEAMCSGISIPRVSKGKLIYSASNRSTWPVDTVEKLAMLLFFFDTESCLDPDITMPIFYYCLGKLSAKELCEELCKKEEFKELKSLISENYENDVNLSKKINPFLDEILSEKYQIFHISKRDVTRFLELISLATTQEDIDFIKVVQTDSNWDEFLESYIESILDYFEEKELPQLSPSDHGYKKAVKKLSEDLKDALGSNVEPLVETYEELSQKAIQSGDVYDLVPSSVLEHMNMGFIDFNDIEFCENVLSSEVLPTYAVCGNDFLEQFSVPQRITRIEKKAFFNCPALKRVILHERITYIDNDAFGNCKNVMLLGVGNSYAEQYAKAQNILWKELNSDDQRVMQMKRSSLIKSDLKTSIIGCFEIDLVDTVSFEGKIFVLTGFGLKDEKRLTEDIGKRGGTVKSSVILSTDYLVVNTQYDHETKKYLRALELKDQSKKILIISKETLYRAIEKD